MGLFDGLAKMGIKNVDATELYAEKKAQVEEAKVPVEKEIPVINESDFVFLKTYECPVCDTKYKALTMKANKARLVSMDKDLRPIFEGVEPLKYEAVCCPACGYSVMTKYIGPLSPSQRKPIIDNISQTFTGLEDEEVTASYEQALERTKLALAAAMFKRAKASEKAYICLKGGWLCRSYSENLMPDRDNYLEIKESLKADEKEFLDNAYEGFINARQSEDFPIAGMDSVTLDYLIAVMAIDRDQFDVASKMLAGVIQNPNANTKIKDKARALKDELVIKIKERKAAQ